MLTLCCIVLPSTRWALGFQCCALVKWSLGFRLIMEKVQMRSYFKFYHSSALNKYTEIQKLHSSPTRLCDTSERPIRKHFRRIILEISAALEGISLNLVLILVILKKSKAVLIASSWHIGGRICFGGVEDSFNPQTLRNRERSAHPCLPGHFHKAQSGLN